MNMKKDSDWQPDFSMFDVSAFSEEDHLYASKKHKIIPAVFFHSLNLIGFNFITALLANTLVTVGIQDNISAYRTHEYFV